MQKTQIIFLVFFLFFVAAMTDSEPPSTEAKVYIVHTENPQDQQPEEFHIKTLASVLGSEDAAKEALIYSYKHAASGFAAKLTPEQVSELAIVMRVEKDFLSIFHSFIRFEKPHNWFRRRKTWGLANCPKQNTPFTWTGAYVKTNSCDSITKPIYLDMSTYGLVIYVLTEYVEN